MANNSKYGWIISTNEIHVRYLSNINSQNKNLNKGFVLTFKIKRYFEYYHHQGSQQHVKE